jgi:hypothetical protein
MTTKCTRCEDTGWVCEAHEDRPWDSGAAKKPCQCGAPGMPCLLCNQSDPPRRREAPVNRLCFVCCTSQHGGFT